MSISLILALALLVATVLAHGAGRRAALAAAAPTTPGGPAGKLHSRPGYHGWFVAIWSVGPAAVLLVAFALFGPRIGSAILQAVLPADVRALPDERLALFLRDARALAFDGEASAVTPVLEAAAATLLRIDTIATFVVAALVVIAVLVGFWGARGRIERSFRARNEVERVIGAALIASSAIAIFTTGAILASLAFEAARFFTMVPITEFLFGTTWSPQTALRADQVGGSGAFGAVPLFYGTLMITLIAMLVAAPIGLYSAVFLSEYAGKRARATIKPLLEILAGIPTVVYGFFALLTVGPFIRFGIAEPLGLDVPTQSALAAGLVMGIMIIPFVSSLADDVINAVPQTLRDGSYALGATRSETVRKVVLPAALPGVMGAFLLAISRAIGETMIVVMAAGRLANMPINPLESVTTITVQIVALLTGDQEFDSPKTLSAFALGFVLFIITLAMNIIALRIVRKYREKYD